eukprot:TRINITY_DN20052_c0_g1_i1.p1 TRINITY_DN20052_c0_g1~~TRINITY_DN20052_c0_g1_i1.p1  ORF type:complete len:1036 (-),score=125.21 TRINITY_DN20052_c0_g1_i1:157-3228(-)
MDDSDESDAAPKSMKSYVHQMDTRVIPALGLNFVLFVGALFLFHCLRNTRTMARVYEVRRDARFYEDANELPPASLQRAVFRGFWQSLRGSWPSGGPTDLQRYIGVDGVVTVRFATMCFKFCLGYAPVALGLCVYYSSGSKGMPNLAAFDISNQVGLPCAGVAVLSAYYLSGLLMFLLCVEYRHFCLMRIAYFTREYVTRTDGQAVVAAAVGAGTCAERVEVPLGCCGCNSGLQGGIRQAAADIVRHSVMVERLPRSVTRHCELVRLFEHLFGQGSIEQAVVCHDSKTMRKAVQRHKALVQLLEAERRDAEFEAAYERDLRRMQMSDPEAVREIDPVGVAAEVVQGEVSGGDAAAVRIINLKTSFCGKCCRSWASRNLAWLSVRARGLKVVYIRVQREARRRLRRQSLDKQLGECTAEVVLLFEEAMANTGENVDFRVNGSWECLRPRLSSDGRDDLGVFTKRGDMIGNTCTVLRYCLEAVRKAFALMILSSPESSTGFVTFKRQLEQTMAMQMLLQHSSLGMVAKEAPPPSDVIWRNVVVPDEQKRSRSILSFVVTLILLLCWSGIAAAIQAVANWGKIRWTMRTYLPQLEMLLSHLIVSDRWGQLMEGLLTSYLPICAWLLTVAILPHIFRFFLVYYERHKRWSRVTMYSFQRYHLFQMVTIYVSVLSGSFITQNPDLLEVTVGVIRAIAASIDTVSGYFICLILTKLGLRGANYLLRPGPILEWCVRFLSTIPRKSSPQCVEGCNGCHVTSSASFASAEVVAKTTQDSRQEGEATSGSMFSLFAPLLQIGGQGSVRSDSCDPACQSGGSSSAGPVRPRLLGGKCNETAWKAEKLLGEGPFFERILTDLMLTLALCQMYGVISPLIVFAGGAYFGVTAAVVRYNYLFVYIQEYDAGGKIFFSLFDRAAATLVIALLVLQCYILAVFHPEYSSTTFVLRAAIPVLILTVLFFWYMCHKWYYASSTTMSMQKLVEPQARLIAQSPSSTLRKRQFEDASISQARAIWLEANRVTLEDQQPSEFS